ncbi:unnamed protein product [Brassicogethes aeneus]|uniref:Aminoacyl-transfer RNA synthetases class-II family profile domain-containing protein n=1 Tax=Brassicogethes aeneus TaxID=1431903 RepID=A0A9P0BEU0_BRAAE|nr:unnamed protein product [Brassicogethes aeneus]
MNTETPNLKEIEKWKVKSKIVKGDLNNLKDSYYSVKEAVNLQILSLPNILHNKTPISEEIIHQVHEKPEKIDKSHLQIADTSIHYINPYNCYLKEDPALFEMSVLNYLRKKLLKLNFTQFSSPDFSRSVIVEGCGKKFDDSTTFTIDEPHEKSNSLSRLHLTGGSSIESFMCYFARHLVDFNKLPLKIFSTGRKYQPYDENLPFDLFNLSQGSVLNVFIAYLDKEDEIINKLQDLIVDFYDSLGYHFMLTLTPASKLTLPESLRFSVKMYSNYTEKYIEVANISLYDEYLTKLIMREDLNFNVLPIVNDFNVLNRGLMTNVSSNAYYGYQAHLQQNKTKQLNEKCELMDFECESNKTRNNSRKRAWDYDELHSFKKRRQEDCCRENEKNEKKCQQMELLEEELLRETHGCSWYHWTSKNSL